LRVRSLSTAIACAAASAVPVLPAAAAGPPTPLALSCTSCHVSPLTQTASIPSLSALSSAEIGEALRDYASGKRAGVIMPRLAPALSESDIASLSVYFGRAEAESAMQDEAP
jgi:sulfide dehydrogenase cytochrome subunit